MVPGARFRRRLRLDTYGHYPTHAAAYDGGESGVRPRELPAHVFDQLPDSSFNTHALASQCGRSRSSAPKRTLPTRSARCVWRTWTPTLKGHGDAAAFLDGDLHGLFAARGIALDEVARQTVVDRLAAV